MLNIVENTCDSNQAAVGTPNGLFYGEMVRNTSTLIVLKNPFVFHTQVDRQGNAQTGLVPFVQIPADQIEIVSPTFIVRVQDMDAAFARHIQSSYAQLVMAQRAARSGIVMPGRG